MKKLLLFLFCIPFLGIAQNSHTINTSGNTFSPVNLTITVGDTVTWSNTAGFHNVNATQTTFPNNPDGFGNVVAGAGWSFQWIFTMAGTYDYQCDPHAPGMSGVIIANALPVAGCTDTLALNFDSLATIDDGSCTYPLVYENLFISEWGEGSSYNKYFEVFNPTNDTINLSNYAYARVNGNPATNGVYEYWSDFDSGSVILPSDVFIVAHSTADSIILANADMLVSGTTALSNGDDGLALVFGSEPTSPIAPDGVTYAILDWLGDWNGDPGQGWTIGSINAATRDHTIIRKCNITNGDTSWANSAANQWIVFPQNYWNNIGTHTFNTIVYDSLSFTVCSGLSVIVGSNSYDSTGVYTDVLIAANGCDSIVITDLTVLNSAASVIVNNTIICDGDSILVDSNYYYITGTYIDTLQNLAGCDSIITTNLTVQTPTYQDITICDGNSILVGNSVYNTNGSYTDTITSSFGCDSIVYTNLTIYSQFNSIFGGIPNNTVATGGMYTGNRSLILDCQLPSEIISTVVYSADTNLITFELRDANGIVIEDTTHQLFPGVQRVILNFELSPGNTYQIGVNGSGSGLYRNNSGANYPYQLGALATITGTTSSNQNYYYFYYDIEIQQTSQPINYSICAGDSIVVGGNAYTTTGLYTDSLTSSIGCDSLVFTNLVVNPNIAFTNNQTICIGETYTVNGNIYDTTGTYIDSLQTISGCDSIVTTNLTILSISSGSSINNQTICIGDSIMIGTSTYFMNGTYFDTLISSNSCDSIVTTNLTVQTANYTSINGGILDTVNGPGDFSNYNGSLLLNASVATLIKSANVYALDTNIVTFELRDSSGLVLESVTHTVYPGIQNLNFNFTLPIGTDYQLGINGGNPALYRGNADTTTFAYPFISGPVSITSSVAGNQYYYFYYDIEFMPFSSYNEVNLCPGDSLTVGSNVYSIAGQYTDVLVANNSCDSIVVTVLDFYQTPQLMISSSPSPAEICLGETILLEGSAGFSYYWWDNGSTGSILTDVPTEDTWYLLSAKDSNDCVVKKDIWVFVDSCITGFEDLGFEEGELQIYPNPASNKLTIDFKGSATSIKVYNMLGELVIEKHITEGENSVQLFVKEWKGAMYSLQLYRENGIISHEVFTVVR